MRKSLKRIAIQLRREGYSYSEILKKVPVAKSTLSLWLRSVNLTNSQKQKLTLKKLKSAKEEQRKRDLREL
jgi:transposase